LWGFGSHVEVKWAMIRSASAARVGTRLASMVSRLIRNTGSMAIIDASPPKL
jgi:hypothetical protein